MSRPLRRLAASAIACFALCGLMSTPALGMARPNTGTWPAPFATTHFMVHRAPYVNVDDAQKYADYFEAAYATEVGTWGFNAPLPDDDGLIDVYMFDPNVDYPYTGARPDNDTAATTSGFVIFSPIAAMPPMSGASYAAAQVFHLIQYSLFAHAVKLLDYGTAEWAATNATARTSWGTYYWHFPGQSLDCTGQCGDYSASHWVFFEYLSERYGRDIVKEIYQQVASLQADTAEKGLDAIDAVLTAHGSSLAQAFNGFTAANAADAYTIAGLANQPGMLQLSQGVLTGVTSIGQVQSWKIDHLAASYVPIVSGDGRTKLSNCGAATLHLKVTIPTGVPSQPSFLDGSGLHPLNLSHTNATIDRPWTNCDGTQGTLVLPNASRTVDGAQFVASISVDVVSPKPAAGTTAPRIRLIHMPVRATVMRNRPYLAFRVRSTAAGTLGVLLKARYIRHSFRLHPGTNDLRLKLPRSFHGGRRQIVFTAYSTTGARGQTVKRHITIRFAS
jgi:hypothetical protein